MWREKIMQEFPGAIAGPELTRKVISFLSAQGFTPETTVFSNSTCPDEINRKVTTFADHFGENFTMGGLAGYPFAGVSGFNAFSHHAPDETGNRQLFVLYGPHIGVSEEGELGRIKRRGMKQCTTACGSLVGAYSGIKESWDRGRVYVPEFDSKDQQQYWVTNLLARYAPKIMQSGNPMKTVVLSMYNSIDNAMIKIVHGSNYTGKVALLGGIQINTPNSSDNYFLPMRFEIFDTTQGEAQDCLEAVQNGH